MEIKKPVITAVVCLLFAAGLYGQREIAPRVGGLERDTVYMTLLAREHTLRSAEDSLGGEIASLRERFASVTDAASRREMGRELMAMESDLFEIKTDIGRVVSQTSAIEQRAVLDNMDSAFASSGSVPGSASARSGYSGLDDFLRKNLPAEEFSQLEAYRRSEAEIDTLCRRYTVLYADIVRTASAYAAAGTPREADSLYNGYLASMDAIYGLQDKFVSLWGGQSDNSIYIYSLILDKLNRLDVVEALYEKGLVTKVAADSVMSAPFAEYPLQRSLLLSYETAIAGIAGLPAAVTDSLRSLQERVERERLDFSAVDITERDFADFTPVAITAPSVYNSSNPIPALAVPDWGTYYGVTVGTFSSLQPVSTFRGAHPVWVEKIPTGQYRYYVGLYRTFGAAWESSLMLAREGFRRPQPVVWKDGKYENLAEAAAQNAGLFNVRIKGVPGDPGRDLRSAIEKYAPGKDVARAGDTYSVGLFDNRLHAVELAGAVAAIGLEASIETIE